MTDLEKFPEHLVHETLEDRGGVGESIRHNAVLVVTRRGDEGCLLFVPFADSNKVISATQVQLGEDLGSTEFLEGGRDQGKWIQQLDCL